MYVIYQLRNTINGKVYIGKTNDLTRRLREHWSEANRARRNQPLYNAVRKYGVGAFEVSILAESSNEDEAYQLECKLITSSRSNRKRFGYNLTDGGDGVRGISDAERSRRSERAKKYVGDKNPFYGKKHTPETRAKMSALPRSRGEQHPMWGKPPSEETRRRISLANSGRTLTPEQRAEVGVRFSGEKSSTAKVTNQQAAEIRARYRNGVPAKILQAEYGLSYNSVWRIGVGITFKDLP